MSRPEPHSVLCIDHENSYLYTEVIQTAEMRPLYWVRPIALRVVSGQPYNLQSDISAGAELHDLCHEVDLLLPCCLFRPVLDIEFVSVLADLLHLKRNLEGDRQPYSQLQKFIYGVCKANPNAFTY